MQAPRASTSIHLLAGLQTSEEGVLGVQEGEKQKTRQHTRTRIGIVGSREEHDRGTIWAEIFERSAEGGGKDEGGGRGDDVKSIWKCAGRFEVDVLSDVQQECGTSVKVLKAEKLCSSHSDRRKRRAIPLVLWASETSFGLAELRPEGLELVRAAKLPAGWCVEESVDPSGVVGSESRRSFLAPGPTAAVMVRRSGNCHEGKQHSQATGEEAEVEVALAVLQRVPDCHEGHAGWKLRLYSYGHHHRGHYPARSPFSMCTCSLKAFFLDTFRPFGFQEDDAENLKCLAACGGEFMVHGIWNGDQQNSNCVEKDKGRHSWIVLPPKDLAKDTVDVRLVRDQDVTQSNERLVSWALGSSPIACSSHFVLVTTQGELMDIRNGKIYWKASLGFGFDQVRVSSLLHVDQKGDLAVMECFDLQGGRPALRLIRIGDREQEICGRESDGIVNRDQNHFTSHLELTCVLCTAKSQSSCAPGKSGVTLWSVSSDRIKAAGRGLVKVTESSLECGNRDSRSSCTLPSGLAVCEWRLPRWLPEEAQVTATEKNEEESPSPSDLLSDLIQNRLTLELEMMSEEEAQQKKMKQMLEDSNTRLRNWANESMYKFRRTPAGQKVETSSSRLSSERERILASLQDSIQVKRLEGKFLARYFVVKCELGLASKARSDVDLHIGTSLALFNARSKGSESGVTVVESSCRRAPFTKLSRERSFKFEIYFDVRNMVLSAGLGVKGAGPSVEIFVCGFCQIYGELPLLSGVDHSPKFTQTCGLAVDPFDGDLPFTHHLGDVEVDLQQMLTANAQHSRETNGKDLLFCAIDYPCKVEVLLLSGESGSLYQAENSQAFQTFKAMCTELSDTSSAVLDQERSGFSSCKTYWMVENPLSPLAGCVLAMDATRSTGPLVMYAHSSEQMLLLMEYLQHSLDQLDGSAGLTLSPSLAWYPTLDSFHHASLLLEFEIRQYRHLHAANAEATRATNEAFSACTW